MKKFLLILGIAAFNLCAFAIESDFKNSLLKVDYVKTGADSYAIRLFTQKPYSEPIKVIKKTNTNYYILLPETFHSIGSVAPTGDIKSTEVKLFPYAGQDLNNGYTKISIFTSKPLNISAQLNSSTGAVAPSIDPKKLSQLDSAFNTKQAQTNEAQRQAQYAAQQKQLAARKEAQRQAQLKAQQEAQARAKAQQEAQARAAAQRQAQLKAQQEAQARAQAQREAAQKAQAQREAQLRAQQEAQRQAQIKAQQEAQARAKAQQEAQRKVQTTQQTQPAVQPKNTNNLQLPDGTENKYEQSANEKKSDTESLNKTPNENLSQNEQNIVTQEIPNAQEIEKTLTQIPENPEKLSKKAYIKKILKNKLKPYIIHLKPYYYIVKDNFILFSALLIAFMGILILAAIGKSKKRGAAQNMEKEETPSEVTTETNVQTTLETTTEVQESSTVDEIQAFKDEFKDLAYDEPEQVQSVEENKEEEYIEPQVLTSAEIAPNRGFMVIEQQGTKALFGYIYDNIFLLYKFKEFLANYEIKYRISEKQSDKTFFIVKINKIKLLIRVTNTSMKLELEM